MGTSVSQRSSGRGPWAAQHAVIGQNSVPVVRQVQEVWRAALGDRERALADEMCAAEIVGAARIANSGAKPAAAAASFDEALYESDSGSMVVEFAKRSLVRAASQEGGAVAYGADLFAEAASYLVARDLPSYVGAEGRVASTLAAIDFKNTVREMSRDAALQVAKTFHADALVTAEGWRAFVTATAKVLASEGGDA